MTAPSNTSRCGSARRGSIYVLVLITVTAAVTMVVTGMALQRVWTKWTRLTADQAEARVLARSAVELGTQYVNSNTNWRTTLAPNGQWLTNAALGQGTITVLATDTVDNNIANNTDDPLVLTGTGVVGQARQMTSVTLTPVFQPMPVLSTSLFALTSINDFKANVVFTSVNVAASNGNIIGSGGLVVAPVEASGTITGSVFINGQTAGVAARTLPTFAAASAFYTANGTSIVRTNIPSMTIQRVLISPASNPYAGAANPRGIYLIDCANTALTITNCRIVGTLIITNCTQLTVSASVLWEPAVAGYPALMVNGPLRITVTASALSEIALTTNFNPPSTPYNGTSNLLTTDSYPSQIRGIVYSSNDLTSTGSTSLALQGVLLCGGTATPNGTWTITSDPNLASAPPPGFRAGSTMVVQPGTWRQAVN